LTYVRNVVAGGGGCVGGGAPQAMCGRRTQHNGPRGQPGCEREKPCNWGVDAMRKACPCATV
jgi:hypothetical protein